MLYLREVRLLLVVLIILVVIGFMLSYINLIVKANANEGKVVIYKDGMSTYKKKAKKSIETTPSHVTEFFAKSIDHAEKMLYNSAYLDGYKNRAPLDLSQMDMQTKRSIVIAMRYAIIEPVSARAYEMRYKMIAEQKDVPFWFVCLWEAIEKVIPEKPAIQTFSDKELKEELDRRNSSQANTSTEKKNDGAKIIPISQVA